jgi:hypothetical protein
VGEWLEVVWRGVGVKRRGGKWLEGAWWEVEGRERADHSNEVPVTAI